MTGLVRYEAARLAIQECVKVDEAKDIADKAQGMQAYARQARDKDLESWVAEIRVRARTRIGELSAELEKSPPGPAPGDKSQRRDVSSKRATLAAAGISKDEAHRCEKLAALKKEAPAVFESVIAAKREQKAAVTADDIEKAIRKTAKQEKPKARVIEHGQKCCHVSDLARLADSGIKFGTIYADPAWQYGNQATRASTGDHYVGMSVDEICALPVAPLAADSAHLHLWTTNAFLFDAKRVMEAWGFEYRSCFIWVKPQMGMGNYWRVSHEFLLLGIRGSAPFGDRSLMSWGEFPRRQHSAKPEEIRKMIERASQGPRLELFARRQTPGWYVWGNEIERAVFDAAMEAA